MLPRPEHDIETPSMGCVRWGNPYAVLALVVSDLHDRYMRSSFIRALPVSVVLALTAPVLMMFAFPAQAATESVVTHTVPVGTQPNPIAITPDGVTALVANSGSNTVSIIDVPTGSVRSTVSVGPRPTGLAISPDGSTGYVAIFGTLGMPSTFALHWLDIASGTITRTVNPGPSGLLSNLDQVIVSADGQYIYIWSSALGQSVQKVRTSDGAVFTPTYSFPDSSISSVALSADGLRLAISPRLDTAMTDIVNTDTMSRLQAVPLAIASGQVAFSADGSELYVSDPARDEIAVVNTTSYNVARWSSGGDDPRSLVAAESGTVFVSNRTSGSLASLRSSSVTGSVAVVNPQIPVMTDTHERVLVPSTSGNALAIITASTLESELVQVGSSPAKVATARGYAVVSNRDSNTVTIIRLGVLPASGDQVPRAPLQQFGRMESQDCAVAIPDSVLFPGVGEDQRRDGWAMSWAEWPNGGTGGFVCTRQPYFTNSGQWSVG